VSRHRHDVDDRAPDAIGGALERLGQPGVAFKMCCLVLALVTHFTIHRRATRPSQASGKFAACLSLLLWTAVIFGGRAIAFF